MNSFPPVPPEKPSNGFDLSEEIQSFSGLADVLTDKEVKAILCQELKDLGLPNLAVTLIYRTLVFGTGRLETFTGQSFESRLQSLVDRWPALSNLLQTIVNLKHGEKAKDTLKKELLKTIRDGRPADISKIAFDETTSLEMLVTLYTSQGFARLTGHFDEQTLELLNTLRTEMDAHFQDFKTWFQTDRGPELIVPEEEDRSPVSSYRRLHYTSGINNFVGREQERDWLRDFAGVPGELNGDLMFRWMLITGPGGLGKTRLAYEFIRNDLVKALWDSGFLSEVQLERFLSEAEKWVPRRPTFMVIDYPRQSSEKVGKLIGILARNRKKFEFPVRVLLVERIADNTWTDHLVPKKADGYLAEKCCNQPPQGEQDQSTARPNQQQIEWQLPPMTREALVLLMEERFKGEGLQPPRSDELYEAAEKLDRNQAAETEVVPRPLFAAAVADAFIDHFKAHGSWPENLVRDEVLGNIIERERQNWWGPAAETEQERTKHEYALALATLTDGLNLADLRKKSDLFAEAARWLPEAPPDHNTKLLAAMGGNESRLANMEPDILGEFFILDQLRRIQIYPDCCRDFLAGALAIGQLNTAIVLTRILQDFPERFAELNVQDLFAGASERTAVSLAAFVLNFTAIAGKDFEPASVDQMLVRLDGLRAAFPEDREIAQTVANTAVIVSNHAGSAGEWDRVETMLVRLDGLRAAFPEDREIAQAVAMAAVIVSNHAGSAGEWDRVETMLVRLDGLRAAFPEDRKIAQAEANTVFIVSNHAGSAGEWDRVETMHRRLKAISAEFSPEFVVLEIDGEQITIGKLVWFVEDLLKQQ